MVILIFNRQALTNLNKVGEVTSQLKELKVALEFADLSKQRAEGEATLAKERAESATREIKRLELLLAAISEERDRLRKDHAVSKSRDGDDASSKVCDFFNKIDSFVPLSFLMECTIFLVR
jgi:uncharacterized protein (DUF3084 family)